MSVKLCGACKNAAANPCGACREGKPGGRCTCKGATNCTCGDAELAARRKKASKKGFLHWT